MPSRADQLNVFQTFGQPTATSERVGNPRRVVEASVDTPGVSAGPKAPGIEGTASARYGTRPVQATVTAPLPPTFAQLRAEQRRGEVAIYDQESEAA